MCAIFGSISDSSSFQTYLGLCSLQHRGQEGAGIATDYSDEFQVFKEEGLVKNVFTQQILENLKGTLSIGHTRYSTAGEKNKANLQPMLGIAKFGKFAIAHNGNITNADILRKNLEDQGQVFQSSSDTEIILKLIEQNPSSYPITAMQEAFSKIEGAYSVLLMGADCIFAIRDPHGFRPLVYGTGRIGAFFASESAGFNWHGLDSFEEVNPNEIVSISRDKQISKFTLGAPKIERRCIFEHVYFARPDSILFGAPTYDVRKALGRKLAEESPAETSQVVLPVPDSGIAAALGFSEVSGLPFEMGIVRSHYSGRTFIEPAQVLRDLGVRRKLIPIQTVLKGKRVVVVDDSLVRGTTSKQLIQLLREAGASEIHFRVSSPPTIHPCYYGIDTPNFEELIAWKKNTFDLAKILGADSLKFLSLRGLLETVTSFSKGGFCETCFSGNRVTA